MEGLGGEGLEKLTALDCLIFLTLSTDVSRQEEEEGEVDLDLDQSHSERLFNRRKCSKQRQSSQSVPSDRSDVLSRSRMKTLKTMQKK